MALMGWALCYFFKVFYRSLCKLWVVNIERVMHQAAFIRLNHRLFQRMDKGIQCFFIPEWLAGGIQCREPALRD